MNDQSRKIKLVSTLALVLGGFISFMGILRHIVEGAQTSSTIYLLHFAGIFFIGSYFYVKKTEKTEVISFFMILVGFLVTIIRVFNTGGLSGTPIAWLIGAPSLAAFVQGEKWVMPWGIASALAASLPLFFPDWVHGVHSPIVNYIVLALLIVTMSSLMWIFEKQRIKNEETIREQTLKLVQTEKLISVGTLAGGMAHEINNPLAIIKGFSDILIKKVAKSSSDQLVVDQVNRACSMINENVKRISDITQHLLAFTQFGDNNKFEEVAFSDLIDKSLSSNLLEMENVNFSLVDNTKNDKIFCNSILIQEVIHNLISNSLDSISGLAQKWIKIEVDKNEENFVLVITDSGQGLSPEISSRLFDPFFTTKSVGKGRGLGLSLCLNIAQLHEGTLELNQKSINTQFVLTLPVQKTGLGTIHNNS